VKTIIKLAVLLLVAHALYRFVPVYVHFQEFKDAVHETALFAAQKSPFEISERVMQLAVEHQVPVRAEYVQVTQENQKTSIQVRYVEQIEWLPRYRKPMQFEVKADAWQGLPPARR
jgi:hypothetical protein